MLAKRKKIYSEVIAKVLASVTATVTLPEDVKELPMGTPLTSTDGGLTFEPLLTEAHVQDESYATGDMVFSDGHEWESTEDNNTTTPSADEEKWKDLGAWDANGILGDYLRATEPVHVVTMGSVIERNLPNFDATLRVQLFKNKINLV